MSVNQVDLSVIELIRRRTNNNSFKTFLRSPLDFLLSALLTDASIVRFYKSCCGCVEIGNCFEQYEF